MKSSVKKNFIYNLIYRVLTVITPLVTSPIVARALGAEGQGVYAATGAYAGIFVMTALLGVENHGNRCIASAQGDREKIQSLFWSIYAIQIITSLLSVFAFLIFVLMADSDRSIIYLIQGFEIIGALLNIAWFFQGIEEFKTTVCCSIVFKLITVLLVVLLIRNPEDLTLYTFIMAFNMMMSNMVLWFFLKKHIGFQRPEFSVVVRQIKPMMVLFIPILAVRLFHIMDKTMLDVFSSEADVGYYTNVDKLVNIPYSIFYALSSVMLPRMSSLISKGEKQKAREALEGSAELTMILASAMVFGIVSISNEFIPFFLGPGFEKCIGLAYWFAPVIFVKGISILIDNQYLIPNHKDKLYVIALVTGVFVNFVVNLILVRPYGALGAVFGTIAAEMVVLTVELIGTRKEIGFVSMIVKKIFYIFDAAVMFAVVRLVAHCNISFMAVKLMIMIVAGGAVYIALAFLYWRINKNSSFHLYAVDPKKLFKSK